MAERKHSRDEDETQGSSACKRFCGLSPEAEELIHFLEDAEEEGCVAEEEIVCGIMKSLEEEIISSCCSTENEIRTRDVGEVSYLDDELGITCVMGSLLYQPPCSATVGEAWGEVSEIDGDFADGLWYFDDCNSDWLHDFFLYDERQERDIRSGGDDFFLYDERQERDIRSCGDLYEVSEGEPTLLLKQERSCAI
ncbi:hypothetical protein SUGI_1100720 [Cryptomeria japonica]|nr:hypothetical protein SUGI_1100720 [Cryptomeria japonica]